MVSSRPAGEHRGDRERERPDSRREESAREEEVHPPAVDEESGRGQDRNEGRDDGDSRVERDPGVGERVPVEPAGRGERDRPEREHADENELADQP